MTKKLISLSTATMFLALPLFAQGTTTTTSGGASWFPLAAVFAMALASGLCALGQGKAVAGAAEGMARNPGASAAIRFALILGLILIESLALYVFAIIFLFK